MKLHAVLVWTTLVLSANASVAATVRWACENWHPCLGQGNDVAVAVDTEKMT
jgi:hypothetical protein